MNVTKKLLLASLGLIACSWTTCAQDTQDEINKIKLSGKYFLAEATASSKDEAMKIAFGNLMVNISGYCEEKEMEEIPESKVREALKSKSMRRGDEILVLAYVTKDIASSSPVMAKDDAAPLNTPDIITRICGADAFAIMKYLLDKAVDNGVVKTWGKYRTFSNPDKCYLVMLNADRRIIGVLSPEHNGRRKNVKTGELIDREGMNTFAQCVPFCVLVK